MNNRLLIYFIAIIFIFQGCTMIKISVSEKRNPIPMTLDLGENIILTTWGAIRVNKSDFFPSSFQIRSDDKVIYIDPIEITSSEKADYIFITHAHPDHLSLKDINNIIKSETIIVCSKGVSKKLHKFNNEIYVVKPGDTVKFKNITCEAISAYNTRAVFLWIKAHPKSKENVGFILSLNDNIRIYHAGDTDYIPEMQNINNINVALVPIGGDNLTMNAEEAAKIINQLQPDIAVPMHYEIKNKENLHIFKNLIDHNVKVEILE